MEATVEKRVYDHNDVSAIYGVGRDVSYRIIREIRAKYPNGKHPLPKGKIFRHDLKKFENIGNGEEEQ